MWGVQLWHVCPQYLFGHTNRLRHADGVREGVIRRQRSQGVLLRVVPDKRWHALLLEGDVPGRVRMTRAFEPPRCRCSIVVYEYAPRSPPMAASEEVRSTSG